jgi:hypothetical protein
MLQQVEVRSPTKRSTRLSSAMLKASAVPSSLPTHVTTCKHPDEKSSDCRFLGGSISVQTFRPNSPHTLRFAFPDVSLPVTRDVCGYNLGSVRTGATIDGNSTATPATHLSQSSSSFPIVRTEATWGCWIYQYLKCHLTRRLSCCIGIWDAGNRNARSIGFIHFSTLNIKFTSHLFCGSTWIRPRPDKIP